MNNTLDKLLKQKYPTAHAPNEMENIFAGPNAFNPFVAYASASRAVMGTGQASQHVPLRNPEIPLQCSGIEYEFARTAVQTKMPENGRVVTVIHRYDQSMMAPGNICPESYVIVQYEDTSYDAIRLTQFESFDNTFGFEMHPNEEVMSSIRQEGFIPKGAVFAKPASIQQGFYCMGVNANVAFISDPDVAEDGFKISKSFARRCSFNFMTKTTVSFGSKTFPLLIHKGRPFPMVGEYLPEDGLLMACRAYDENLNPVMSSVHDVQEVDHLFDIKEYARPGYRAKIYNIEVYKNNHHRTCPEYVLEHVEKYYQANLRFWQQFEDLDKHLRYQGRRSQGENYNPLYRDQLADLMAQAVAFIRQDTVHAGKVQFLYKKEPLDQYRITFTLLYEVVPTRGYKFTDLSGG